MIRAFALLLALAAPCLAYDGRAAGDTWVKLIAAVNERARATAYADEGTGPVLTNFTAPPLVLVDEYVLNLATVEVQAISFENESAYFSTLIGPVVEITNTTPHTFWTNRELIVTGWEGPCVLAFRAVHLHGYSCLTFNGALAVPRLYATNLVASPGPSLISTYGVKAAYTADTISAASLNTLDAWLKVAPPQFVDMVQVRAYTDAAGWFADSPGVTNWEWTGEEGDGGHWRSWVGRPVSLPALTVSNAWKYAGLPVVARAVGIVTNVPFVYGWTLGILDREWVDDVTVITTNWVYDYGFTRRAEGVYFKSELATAFIGTTQVCLISTNPNTYATPALYTGAVNFTLGQTYPIKTIEHATLPEDVFTGPHPVGVTLEMMPGTTNPVIGGNPAGITATVTGSALVKDGNGVYSLIETSQVATVGDSLLWFVAVNSITSAWSYAQAAGDPEDRPESPYRTRLSVVWSNMEMQVGGNDVFYATTNDLLERARVLTNLLVTCVPGYSVQHPGASVESLHGFYGYHGDGAEWVPDWEDDPDEPPEEIAFRTFTLPALEGCDAYRWCPTPDNPNAYEVNWDCVGRNVWEAYDASAICPTIYRDYPGDILPRGGSSWTMEADLTAWHGTANFGCYEYGYERQSDWFTRYAEIYWSTNDLLTLPRLIHDVEGEAEIFGRWGYNGGHWWGPMEYTAQIGPDRYSRIFVEERYTGGMGSGSRFSEVSVPDGTLTFTIENLPIREMTNVVRYGSAPRGESMSLEVDLSTGVRPCDVAPSYVAYSGPQLWVEDEAGGLVWRWFHPILPQATFQEWQIVTTWTFTNRVPFLEP